MSNDYDAPARRGRMVRWGVGITLAGFVAGGAIAAVATTGNTAPAATGTSTTSANASANNAELSTLLSAANSTASTPGATSKVGPVRRLRQIGGYYGSLTFHTKAGVRTVAFERGTIESVNHGDVVVRAPDGVTMTWLLVSDTVVRDRGKASTSVLSSGQLVFIGGPVVSGAHDARLIVVRTANAAPTPSTSPSPSTSANAS